MGYAPVSTIALGPSPADAGTTLAVVADSGDRYPAPPFVALAWHSQTIPTRGVDAEEVTVTSIDGDNFVIVRDDEPISITTGMQFAALRTITMYSRGEEITLAQTFPALDTGAALHIRTPQGAEGQYTTALTEEAVSGGSAYSLTFSANESGRWFYSFTSDQRVEPEQDFYVRFSEVV